MSDYELLSIVICFISIVVTLLLEIIRNNEKK